MEVSVIIPVYNKAPYVERCLRRLLAQRHDDFEIVAVDDGSTDGSGELCDQMASTDKRIRVFHTANCGVTAARRYGVEQAKGRYILFVDSDDELQSGAIATLHEAIVRTDADEVIGVYRTQKGRVGDSGRRGWQDSASMIDDLLAVRNPFCVLWGIIFKRELLDGCLDTPREVVEREDILMQIKCLVKQPKVFFIGDVVYLYNEGLPHQRVMGLDRIRIHDAELRRALQADWQRHRRGFLLNQLKLYEVFIAQRQFSVYKEYYSSLKDEDLRGLPLADRIAFWLPPRLAYIPIKVRKWLLQFNR